MNEKDLEKLIASIETNQCGAKLHLVDEKIDAIQMKKLSVALINNTSIHTIDLCRVEIGDVGAEALSKALAKNIKLHTLKLDENGIGVAGAEALAAALIMNTTLHTLILDSNKLGASGAKVLASALTKNTALHTLSLRCNNIGNSGTKVLAKALYNNTSLYCLDLGHNKIGPSGAKALAKLLTKTTCLHTLRLGFNSIYFEIGNSAIKALATALIKNTSLHTLDLYSTWSSSWSKDSEAGIKILADALAMNNSLHTLILEGNGIKETAAKDLAVMLRKNKSLRYLDLSGNSDIKAGIKDLCEALVINNTLHTLNLQSCYIDSVGATYLSRALAGNRSLRLLDLDQNWIGDDGAKAIADGLVQNTCLHHLRLNSTHIDLGCKAIADALVKNSSLYLVWFDWDIPKDKVVGTAIKEALLSNREKGAPQKVLEEILKRMEELGAMKPEALRELGAYNFFKQFHSLAQQAKEYMDYLTFSSDASYNREKDALYNRREALIEVCETMINSPIFSSEESFKDKKIAGELETLHGITKSEDLKKLGFFRKFFSRTSSSVSSAAVERKEKRELSLTQEQELATEIRQLLNKARSGDMVAQFNLGEAFYFGRGITQDRKQAAEWYRKAAEQGHTNAKQALGQLQIPSASPDVRAASVTQKMVTAAEVKESHESQMTEEQRRFIGDLQKAGFTPILLEQMQKNSQKSLPSVEELRVFQGWKDELNKKTLILEQGLLDAHQELGIVPDIKVKREYIAAHPKLEAYKKRFEKEFGYFALCYSLAPAGLQLEDNKKDVMISAMSSIPQATIEGIPLVGPLLGKLFGLIPKGLKFANKKHRMKQLNHIKELFHSLTDIGKTTHLLALELTLANEPEIETYHKTEYTGLRKIVGLYEMGKEMAMQQWKNLATSDKAGIKLSPAEELAVLDCAFIMQQVSSEEAIVDLDKELVPQLVEIATGKTYKPWTFSAPSITTTVSSVSTAFSPTPPASSAASPSPLSPLSPSSPAPLSEVEALKEELRAQKEALKRYQAEAEAERAERETARAETKSLAEQLAKVKKQLQPIDVDGGIEALVLEKPEASSSSISTVSFAEFHALKVHVTSMTHTVMQTREQVDGLSATVYDLQDDKKADRSRVGSKQITHARDLAAREAERKRQEEAIQVAQRAKAKQVVTAQDLM